MRKSATFAAEKTTDKLLMKYLDKYLPLMSMLALLCSCEGLFDGLYDKVPDEEQPEVNVVGDTISGTLYIEASAWDEWYYIDFHALQQAMTAAHETGIVDSSQFVFEPYNIPTTLTGEWDGQSRLCTYRFRVLSGGGLNDNEYVSEVPTDPQPAPEAWDLAIHRNDCRTNGGSVLATPIPTIEMLPRSFERLQNELLLGGRDTTFCGDQPTENVIFVDNSTMLSELVPCQAIGVNNVLSSWLVMSIPPFPPTFSHDDSVFLLRMSDGTIAALRLLNYVSPKNVKCCLTIQYKYPY